MDVKMSARSFKMVTATEPQARVALVVLLRDQKWCPSRSNWCHWEPKGKQAKTSRREPSNIGKRILKDTSNIEKRMLKDTSKSGKQMLNNIIEIPLLSPSGGPYVGKFAVSCHFTTGVSNLRFRN